MAPSPLTLGTISLYQGPHMLEFSKCSTQRATSHEDLYAGDSGRQCSLDRASVHLHPVPETDSREGRRICCLSPIQTLASQLG